MTTTTVQRETTRRTERTTYRAVCEPYGGWWAVHVPGTVVHTQARRLDQVEAMARDAIALTYDVGPGSFDVVVDPALPASGAEAVDAVNAARSVASEAERHAFAVMADKIVYLTRELKLSYRDTAQLLGMSHQRVDQLAKAARGSTGGQAHDDGPSREPLSLSELGRLSGGALVVHLSYGGRFKPDPGSPVRPKWGPDHPDDATILDNTRRHWQIGRLLATLWRPTPDARPHALVGLGGTVQHRPVISSLQIEPGWFDVAAAGADPEINVVGDASLNYLGLRGRLVTDARFGTNRQQSFIWVDCHGEVRRGGRGA